MTVPTLIDAEPTRARTAGLTSDQAVARLTADGPNRLPSPRRRPLLLRFAAQLVHFFALMLWVAGVLAFIAGLPELGVAILAVVVLNAGFAFAQESRAERAAQRLRELIPRRVTVRRDAQRVDVDATEVVIGDVVLLDAGDRVPADAVAAVANRTTVDMSLLTGESTAVAVESGGQLFAGTFTITGETEAVVTATGSRTRLAEIARLTTETIKPATPLAIELRRVVRVIAAIALGVGGLFFAVEMLLGNELDDGFVFAVGVTVALVPEALLPTVTLSLAWGAEQMAKRNVLVRHLEAVETLGSTTFICTDKTGTLTRNEMAVVEVWTPHGEAMIAGQGYAPQGIVTTPTVRARDAVVRLARGAMRCSVGYAYKENGEWRAHGDPMEAALDVLARRVGINTDADRGDHLAVARFPFDPATRRMSVVVDGEVVVKGAAETVLPRCAPTPEALAAHDRLAAAGLRVLAVAGRRLDGRIPGCADDAESGLELYGLVGLHDPPRDDVAEAIAACRRAGIKVAMITGDHPATAAAVARETGLLTADAPVLISADLPADEQLLGALVDRDGVVVARVSPEDKLRIARSLRARGHVVAMTGDGVNDGPALHEADIGVAMGRSGTDVARSAADLVLLDDHFASIVAGVEQGRATFVNIRRFLTYHLTDNVAELTPFVVWALSGGRFPLALGILQILALDLGTDTLSAVALGAEPPARHLLDDPPVRGRLLTGTVLRRAFGLLGPTIAAGTMLAFVLSLVAAGWRPGDAFPDGDVVMAASGAAFMTVVIGQTANAFACRSSSRWPGALGWTTNRLLIPAAGIELAFSLAVLLIPPIADELGHASPPLVGWLVALATAVAVLTVDAADKALRRRARHPRR